MLTNEEIVHKAAQLRIPLRGVYSKDLLPSKLQPGAYVINLENSDAGGGSHWTCFIVKQRGPSFYFDSFGMPPPRKVQELIPDCIWSTTDIQNINDGHCGWFCLAFLYWITRRGGTMNSFLRLFSDDVTQNRSVLMTLLKKV